MKILVTGGRGRIGSSVVPVLEKEHEVFVADISDDADMMDLRREGNIRRILGAFGGAGVDVVIHLAAIPHPMLGGFYNYFESNVLMTANLLRACVNAGVKRFIYTSSSAALGGDICCKPIYFPIDEEHPYSFDLSDKSDGYGEPYEYPYPMSKVASEAMCISAAKTTDLEVFVFRLGPISVEELPPNVFWARRALFAFTKLGNLGDAYLAASEVDYTGFEIFHIGIIPSSAVE